jgi:hypothetical protein
VVAAKFGVRADERTKRITDQSAGDDGHRSPGRGLQGPPPPRPPTMRWYPMRKVTRPVPVAGGAAGGAFPMSAGSSFHGRKQPNGSACQRRTMAEVQAEAKHAMRAMSPEGL